MPVIEGDMEAIEIQLATSSDIGDKLLRRDAGFFGGDHDRRTVGIIGTDKMHFMATQSHETPAINHRLSPFWLSCYPQSKFWDAKSWQSCYDSTKFLLLSHSG
jgi:hypothetical protein